MTMENTRSSVAYACKFVQLEMLTKNEIQNRIVLLNIKMNITLKPIDLSGMSTCIVSIAMIK